MFALVFSLMLAWESPQRFVTWPIVEGAVQTQSYSRTHHGLDLAVPVETAVLNVGDGEVIKVSNNPRAESGRYVIVRGIGAFGGLEWSYCHLRRIEVAEGQLLPPFEEIGLSGNSGRSTGPHLHFAVRRNGQWVNPRRLLPEEPHGR